MANNNIHVEAHTKENYKTNVKLTSLHWKVYYYLMCISKYDSQKRENHRYIYKNSFNVTHFAEEIECGRSTFYRAIDRLKQCKLVTETSEYYLLYARNWIEIDRSILKNLLGWSKKEDKYIDLLRVYLIMKKMLATSQNSYDNQFTVRDMCKLLGHNTTDDETYNNIRIYLALLSSWKLIELKTHTAYHKTYGNYTVYHLQKTSEKNLDASFYTDCESDSKCGVMTEERINELKFAFPDIMNDEC